MRAGGGVLKKLVEFNNTCRELKCQQSPSLILTYSCPNPETPCFSNLLNLVYVGL